jgi:hypothetical protein
MLSSGSKIWLSIGRGRPNPIALAAQLIATKDLLTAAKTVRLAQTDVRHSRLEALIDKAEAIRPVLVTYPLHLLPSTFRVPMFIPHSLPPDKSYPDS